MFRLIVRCAFLSALLMFSASPVMATDGPAPPCDDATLSVFANPGEPASVRAWPAASLPASWIPPACLKWHDKNFAVLVAVAGRFDGVAKAAELLQRLAAVSRLTTIRYWSFSRKEWRTLLDKATALDAPDRARERTDFSSGELETARDYFMWQKENSPASGMILRTRFREISDRRLVFDQVNITASDILMITILEPYAFRTRYFMERESGSTWRYHSLTRFGTADQTLTEGQIASVINRSVAIFRYLGGLPMEREPPAAP